MLGLDPFFPAWAVVPRGAGECGSYEFPICATVKVVAYKIGDGRCLPPEKWRNPYNGYIGAPTIGTWVDDFIPY